MAREQKRSPSPEPWTADCGLRTIDRPKPAMVKCLFSRTHRIRSNLFWRTWGMVPDRNEIGATIAAAIRKALSREVGEITPETSLVADLPIDSLDLVEIVYDVEEAFDIQLEPDDLLPARLV